MSEKLARRSSGITRNLAIFSLAFLLLFGVGTTQARATSHINGNCMVAAGLVAQGSLEMWVGGMTANIRLYLKGMRDRQEGYDLAAASGC